MFAKLFDTTSDSLMHLLEMIRSCRIQLPDFQRGWIWDDERIRKLLVSIIQYFPIGAVMMLNIGDANVNFSPRPLEGVDNPNNIRPDQLILDGQQRLTSLYQALMLKTPVKTLDAKNNKIDRRYYIDINALIDPNVDRDDVIISIPGDGLVKGLQGRIQKDYSTIEKECDNEVFPVNLIFDSPKTFDWQKLYTENGTNVERQQKWLKLYEVILRFQQYQIPVISLSKDNSKEAVCSVFENVNTGGVSLTVFELLTATFAADNFRLRQDWQAREERLKNAGKPHGKILEGISNVDFLQALTLLATSKRAGKAVSCKRKDVLSLTVNEYQTYADKLEQGFIDAAIFLQEQYVFSTKDLPYGSQLIPLAALMVELANEVKILTNRQKLARWYWCGVLGELYGGTTETRFVHDFVDVIKWIREPNAPEPLTIIDANFSTQRLYTLKTRNSAAYKGINVLLMKNGARDFVSGVPLDMHNCNNYNIDIHHIFPKAYCLRANIDMDIADCIINKAPLSDGTNRSIGGRKPSEYIATLDKKNSMEVTNDLLRSQCIDVNALRNDDFDLFIEKRKQALINLISVAMGKQVVS